MLFNSVQFVLFFVAVVVMHWAATPRWRNPILLAASYIFYGMWDWRFLGLLLVSTFVDYSVGRLLEGDRPERTRRALLATSVTVNLGILGFFKYANFFADGFVDLAGSIGLAPGQFTLQVILPVGISFYTFQTMSYSIDVYRRRLEPCRSVVDFATYVAYFPQLVAGPIERAHNLLPRLQRTDRSIGRAEIESGLGLILLGLVKKVVLADGVASVADKAFSDPSGLSFVAVAAGVVAFSIQIYGDFSGYTDIARGVSRLLGVELLLNFRQPYLARNITEFWRQWHISLSNWLRDYLYIPLGGNRRGSTLTVVNLMITMLLGGLWHGASWTFVFWVPRGEKRSLMSYGIPEGNILEWDQSERGVQAATVSTDQAFTKFYAARSAGVRSTDKFYADLSKVTITEVKQSLVDISSQVDVYAVDFRNDGVQIKDFVQAQGVAFTKGCAFYQLNKTEAVQEYKQIAIRDKIKGSVYSGFSARNMLGLPQQGEVKLAPGQHGQYEIFVQSTSVNRKLVKGTNILIWATAPV